MRGGTGVSRAILHAAVAYFAIVFACAFALGAFRVLVVAPAVGALAAVAIEMPVVLLISWLAAAWVIARFHVVARMGARLGMGGMAFAILMVAEAFLAHVGFGTPWPEYLAGFTTAPEILGLCGQVLFALVPGLRLVILRR